MSDGLQLFDVPGPRGRFRYRLGSSLAISLLVILALVVLSRLYASSQFDWERWSPIINPGDPDFIALWRSLGRGLLFTLQAAVLAVALSVVFGTILAIARNNSGRLVRVPLIGFIEVIRGLPMVIKIFFIARVFPEIGLSLAGAPGGRFLWYLVIALTLYNTVIISEIIRAGIDSLPRGQREAGEAIGLTRLQVMRFVVLPQAFKNMLPVLISQLVVILKDTSIAAVVLGRYPELLRAASLAIQQLNNPLQLFFVVGVIYVVINVLLARVSVYIEKRVAKSNAAPVSIENLAVTTKVKFL